MIKLKESGLNRVYNMCCIAAMKRLPDNCVDSIVTDPPYELGFMGKKWDNTGIAYNILLWKEALRILKPGGHLLAFGGTRTYHRMTCAIEDAGFEIRDCIQWLYGSGFPKSLNISKQLDKMGGRNSEKEKEISTFLKNRRIELALSMKEVEKEMGWNTWLNWVEGRNYKGEFIIQIPNWNDYEKLKIIYNLDNRFDVYIKAAEREIIGKKESGCFNSDEKNRYTIGASKNVEVNITTSTTPEAKQWEGWGTALKPANEPIVVARKPISEKNIALNVLKWGVGGINIDECRVALNGEKQPIGSAKRIYKANQYTEKKIYGDNKITPELGRFPANIILDEEAGQMLGEPSRFFYCAKASKSERNKGCEELEIKQTTGGGGMNDPQGDDVCGKYGSVKSAGHNHHPTVKPLKLIRYLVRLVTPPNGIVLDPFGGSGTTGIAAKEENLRFILFELNKEYCDIARARIDIYYSNKV